MKGQCDHIGAAFPSANEPVGRRAGIATFVGKQFDHHGYLPELVDPALAVPVPCQLTVKLSPRQTVPSQ